MGRIGRFVSSATIAILAAFCLGGCASTLHLEAKSHLQKFEGGAQAVYVTNPELRREYGILLDSRIYPLSRDPNSPRRLTLQPLRTSARCANPIALTYLSFGIIPGWLPGALTFQYDLVSLGKTEPFAHHLPVYERISLWEVLFRQDQEKVLAQALAQSGRGTVSGPKAVPAYRPPVSAPPFP